MVDFTGNILRAIQYGAAIEAENKEKKWSNTIPEIPGWYWARWTNQSPKVPVQVTEHNTIIIPAEHHDDDLVSNDETWINRICTEYNRNGSTARSYLYYTIPIEVPND